MTDEGVDSMFKNRLLVSHKKAPRPAYSVPLIILSLLLALFFSTNVCAGEIENKPERLVAKRLQQRYDSMRSLSFNFYQHTTAGVGGRPKIGEGQARFLKSTRTAFMRWDYLAPEEQVLTSDGEFFSMYFKQLGQMIITPAKNLESDITYSFFTGKGTLTRDFYIYPADDNVTEELVESERTKIIKLVPKKTQSQVQDIHIWVNASSLITRMQIRDHFGTITVLSLSDIEIDSIADTIESLQNFSFTPPVGTEIIKQ